MKQFYFSLLLAAFCVSLNAQVIDLPAGNFKNKLLTALVVDTNLDGSGDTLLDTNGDGLIQESEALAVQSLVVASSNITSLQGIENFKNLTHLYFHYNSVVNVDLSLLTHLKVLEASSNKLASINVSALNELTYLNVTSNKLTSLDVSGLPNLTTVKCSTNNLLSLFLKNSKPTADLITLELFQLPQLVHICADTVDYPVIQQAIIDGWLTSSNILLDSVCDPANPCGPNIVCIPDLKLKAKLVALGVDTNHDGKIQVSEAEAVTDLSIATSPNDIYDDITDLTGLEKFKNLINFNCSGNSITSFNATALTHIKTIDCSANQLTSLTVSGLTTLTNLNCSKNKLTALNAGGITSLQVLNASENLIASLNVTGDTSLLNLNCNSNQLTSVSLAGLSSIQQANFNNNKVLEYTFSGLTTLQEIYVSKNTNATALNISNLPNLKYLDCSYTKIPALDISSLTKLVSFNCDNVELLHDLDASGLQFLTKLSCKFTNITNLDLSGSPLLQQLAIDYTGSLIYLNIKNGSVMSNANFTHVLSGLKYMCVDANELALIQNVLDASFHPELSTTCNFGTIDNTITGVLRMDLNGNCQSNSTVIKNARLNSSASAFNTTFTNTQGAYSFSTMQNTVTVTPVFKNNYFTAVPESYSYTFPQTGTSTTADFCIVPNGIHHDLEINPYTISRPRPGFETAIRLTYKNNGNQMMSGTVKLVFNPNKMQFVISDVTVASSQSGNLIWNFSNLMPFESRTIVIRLLVNTPNGAQPANIGDIVEYTASVSSDTNVADENPADNTSTFKNEVFGSYDPNDKTALEGRYISLAKAQEPVNYLVRFQNTGNAAAEIVKIEDEIAPEFDLSTLEIINYSHPCKVTLKGNKLIATFNDINLAAASQNEAASQGFIAFKIKPVNTVSVGTTFNNTAEIYFDFNDAIITNTATTSITSLGINDFSFKNNFRLYPNPASTQLNIEVLSSLEVNTINIYNTLGQLVKTVTGTAMQNTIVDISSLQSGQYYINIITNGGKATEKFIKI